MSWIRLIAAVFLMSVTGSACSFIWSSESISDSSKSSSESSASSSPESQEAAYKKDVTDYTYAYVTSGGSGNDFRQGIAKLAEKHGITNWEADSNTYVAVGQGLGKAKANGAQLEAYKQSMAGNSPSNQKAIQKGYDDARS